MHPRTAKRTFNERFGFGGPDCRRTWRAASTLAACRQSRAKRSLALDSCGAISADAACTSCGGCSSLWRPDMWRFHWRNLNDAESTGVLATLKDLLHQARQMVSQPQSSQGPSYSRPWRSHLGFVRSGFGSVSAFCSRRSWRSSGTGEFSTQDDSISGEAAAAVFAPSGKRCLSDPFGVVWAGDDAGTRTRSPGSVGQ